MDADIKEIAAWLQQRARTMSLRARLHPELARREHNWIYFPVRIEGVIGAFERAERLQDLEDQWEVENSSKNIHLTLLPAAE